MVMPGLINLDFADVRSVMGEMGKAMMGTGEAEGDNRAIEAAEKAIANPLLDGVSMKGAKGVIVSITGGDDMRLMEVDEAANHIRELVDPDANIIWGSAFNNDLEGKIRVSVVATGIDQDVIQPEQMQRPLALAGGRGPVRPVAVTQPAGFAPQPPMVAASAPAEPPALILEAPDGAPSNLAQLHPRAEPLDLGFDQIAPEPAARPAVQDELLLGSENLAAPVTSLDAVRKAQAAPEPAPQPQQQGTTLFERMANLSRNRPAEEPAAPKAAESTGSVSFPRFLNRQNNQ